MLGLFYILSCWVAGNVIAHFTGNAISGNIIGMILMFCALQFRLFDAEKVRPAAKFLLGSMALFFVPYGVGLMVSYEAILKNLWAIVVASVVSTVLIMAVVGWVYQKNGAQEMMEIIRSDLFLLTLTIGIFSGCSSLYRRTKFALLHPVMLTFAAMIAFLKIFAIPYEHYRAATEVLNFALGMSVVSLGYLLYEQKSQMKGEIVPVLSSIVTGCAVGIVSVVYIAKFMGAERMILTSIAPKSVTIPIAVAVAEPLGGEVTITSVVVFCVGVLGNMIGFWVLDKIHVRNPKAQGLAMGAAAHGVGTARAIEHGAVEGAMSGLAMALMGVATALMLPLVEKFLY